MNTQANKLGREENVNILLTLTYFLKMQWERGKTVIRSFHYISLCSNSDDEDDDILITGPKWSSEKSTHICRLCNLCGEDIMLSDRV